MTNTTSTQNITTTKGELDHGEDSTIGWVAVRWLDTDYVECSPVVAEHGQWDDADMVEVIERPTGHLCDAHREMLAGGEWAETEVRAACSLAE